MILAIFRSSRPQVFLVKVVLKICSIFTGEHPLQSVISIKLLCNFFEITLRPGCSRVNLLHIFRTPFPKNTSGRLLVYSTHSLCIVIFIVLSVLIVHCLLKILKRFKEMCRQMKSFRCFIKWPLKSALLSRSWITHSQIKCFLL